MHIDCVEKSLYARFRIVVQGVATEKSVVGARSEFQQNVLEFH